MTDSQILMQLKLDAQRYRDLREYAVERGKSIDPEHLSQGDFAAFDAFADQIGYELEA